MENNTVHVIVSTLKRLKKIKISGNAYISGDSFLHNLEVNSPYLDVRCCSFVEGITIEGITAFFT
jgi:hypothetical protein